MSSLPDEIVQEICVRLPLFDLVRFLSSDPHHFNLCRRQLPAAYIEEIYHRRERNVLDQFVDEINTYTSAVIEEFFQVAEIRPLYARTEVNRFAQRFDEPEQVIHWLFELVPAFIHDDLYYHPDPLYLEAHELDQVACRLSGDDEERKKEIYTQLDAFLTDHGVFMCKQRSYSTPYPN
jgi:hypothetical protein